MRSGNHCILFLHFTQCHNLMRGIWGLYIQWLYTVQVHTVAWQVKGHSISAGDSVPFGVVTGKAPGVKLPNNMQNSLVTKEQRKVAVQGSIIHEFTEGMSCCCSFGISKNRPSGCMFYHPDFPSLVSVMTHADSPFFQSPQSPSSNYLMYCVVHILLQLTQPPNYTL